MSGTGTEPKKKGGLLTCVVIGILAVFFVLRLIASAGDLIGSFLGGSESAADEVRTLKDGLPVISTGTPDIGGYITSFGGLYFAVPRGYTAGHSGGQYVVMHPENPKKIDQLTAIHDGTYTSKWEDDVLDKYKGEFDRVAAVATKKMEDYRLYYIAGKKKIDKKSCTAVCFLILKEDEMYAVTMESSLKKSNLGMAAEYLAFNPSVKFGE